MAMGGMAYGGAMAMGGMAYGGAMAMGGMAYGGAMAMGGMAYGGAMAMGGMAYGGAMAMGGMAYGGGMMYGGGGMAMGMGAMGIPGQNCLGFNQFNGGLGAFGTGGLDQGLILLIRQVVAPGQWDVLNCQLQYTGFPGAGIPPAGAPGGGPGGTPGFPGQPGAPTIDPADQAKVNHIAFYPAALALVVQGTATKHHKYGGGIFGGGTKKKEAAASYQERSKDPGVIVIGPRPDGGVDVAGGKDTAPKNVAKIDPKTVWQEALQQGAQNPGLIVACADFLFEHEEYGHAVELLKATLRQGIVVQPWVYEALAIAMEFEGADLSEVRRAKLSAISLNPKDARSYVKAAQAYGEHEMYDKALAFCEQAATIDPGMAQVYAEALDYAEKAKNTKAMQWAYGKLVGRDWAGDNDYLHEKAELKANSLVKALSKEKRNQEADALRMALAAKMQRDLTIILTWQAGVSGNADLELEVKEPTGAVCSSQHRQSSGGGVFTGLNLDSPTRGVYTACEAFPGQYDLTVKRLWGQPAGGKFRLEVVYYQGTAKERHEVHTLVLDQQQTLKIKLDNGRRTELAVVAPTVAATRPSRDDDVKGADVLTKLRDMADSVHSQLPRGIGVGGATAKGRLPALPDPKKAPSQMNLVYQSTVGSAQNGGMVVTTQASVSADGQYMRLSVNPVFQPGAAGNARPKVDLPLIPGAGQ
jgi:tetratricopeptide (TPR) repeat protein